MRAERGQGRGADEGRTTGSRGRNADEIGGSTQEGGPAGRCSSRRAATGGQTGRCGKDRGHRQCSATGSAVQQAVRCSQQRSQQGSPGREAKSMPACWHTWASSLVVMTWSTSLQVGQQRAAEGRAGRAREGKREAGKLTTRAGPEGQGRGGKEASQQSGQDSTQPAPAGQG